MEPPLDIPLARPAAWPLFGPALRIGLTGRLLWAVVGSVCLVVLTLATWLPPDPRGFGTHEALSGAWPCGFILTTGLPCPTCGMTTAFSLLMHGRPLAAVVAQPAGAFLCLATACTLVLSIHVTATGRVPNVNWNRIGPVRLSLGLALLLLGGWGFKLAHGLLTGALPTK